MAAEEHFLLVDGADEALEKTLLGNLRTETLQRTEGLPKTKQCFYFFLKDDAGNVTAGIFAETKGLWLHIRYLWVAEDLRRRGIGTRLLEAALEEGHRRGCRSAHLETYSWEAPDFYRKNGFQEFGRLEGIYGRFDFFYFRKAIKPGLKAPDAGAD